MFAAVALSLAGCDEEGYDFFNLEDPEQAYGTPTDTQTQAGTPRSAQVPISTVPFVLPNFILSCPSSPIDPNDNGYCPVVQWDGVTYWAFSQPNGRRGIQVAAFDDATGAARGGWHKPATSDVYDIVIDLDAQRVEFRGMDGTYARIRFSELRVY